MAKSTKFRKLKSGGVDQGDSNLNRFGSVPIWQRSAGVSAVGQARIGTVPDDGAYVLEILTYVDVAVGGSAAAMTIDFGVSANTSAFGVILVSAIGRYALPTNNHPLQSGFVVQVSGSNYYVATAGTEVVATITSASGGAATPPGCQFFTCFMQEERDI